MEKEVNIEEIKRKLKDANMYEENVSNEVLRSYYEVLMNSENTANQEEESRKLSESLAIEPLDIETENDDESQKEMSAPIKEKTWSTSKKNIMSENKQKSQSDEIMDDLNANGPKDATKAIFGFNEMLESLEKNAYNIIKHDLKYIPVQCTAQFLKADSKTKARLLYAYHSKLHDIRDHLARQSLFPAPIPKAAINVNHQANLMGNADLNETYVSRSGRQTKRKIYYDENSLDDDFETLTSKKHKNKEDEWVDKTTAIRNNKVKIGEKQVDHSDEVPVTNENMVENLDNVDKGIIEDENKITVTDKTKNEVAKSESNSKFIPKFYTSKKLSNSEIMQRSKLFKDSPRRGPRSEILFDKLIEESEKKEKEEKVMRDFEKTLKELDEEECATGEKSEKDNEEIIDIDDEEPIRKRVVPPLPGRRPINKRKNNSNDLTPLPVVTHNQSSKSKENSNSSQSSEEIVIVSPNKKRSNVSKRTPRSDRKNIASSNQKNTPSTSQNNTQECPICREYFPKDKIQEHASTCGDENEVVTRSSAKFSKMLCDICDTVIPLTTSYEVHVKDCIRARELRESK